MSGLRFTSVVIAGCLTGMQPSSQTAPSSTDPQGKGTEAKTEHARTATVPDTRTQEESGAEEKAERSAELSTRPRLVVVVSPSNPIECLEIGELRRIFLRQKTHWENNRAITVYERSVEYPIRHEFSRRVFNKQPSELKEYWMNLQLTRGLKPPKVLRSARLVKSYLQRVKGGIAYVYEGEVDDTVRVVEVKGLNRVAQER